eukprot:scaffold20982_cov70-Cyclotella_meneghiniana.AAC.1
MRRLARQPIGSHESCIVAPATLDQRPTSHPSSRLNQYIKKSFQNYEEELRDAKNIDTQSTTTIADIRNQRNSKSQAQQDTLLCMQVQENEHGMIRSHEVYHQDTGYNCNTTMVLSAV